MKQMINPMFTEKVKPIVKVGEVKPVQIYEENYVEKRNIKNVELYKEYKKVSELIANGGEVKEEELKKAMTSFETKVKSELGSRLKTSTSSPAAVTTTVTPHSSTPSGSPVGGA